MPGKLFNYVRRHHVGLAALFVALGGTAFAVSHAPRDSVVSKSIKDGQVKPQDVKIAKTFNFPGTATVSNGDFIELDPVTVRIPKSGLVSIYAQSDIRKTAGAASLPCTVSLSLTGGVPYSPLVNAAFTTSSFQTKHTAPASEGEGVPQAERSGLITFPVDPGKQSFRISYGAFNGASCMFKNTRLVIIPVP